MGQQLLLQKGKGRFGKEIDSKWKTALGIRIFWIIAEK